MSVAQLDREALRDWAEKERLTEQSAPDPAVALMVERLTGIMSRVANTREAQPDMRQGLMLAAALFHLVRWPGWEGASVASVASELGVCKAHYYRRLRRTADELGLPIPFQKSAEQRMHLRHPRASNDGMEAK